MLAAALAAARPEFGDAALAYVGTLDDERAKATAHRVARMLFTPARG